MAVETLEEDLGTAGKGLVVISFQPAFPDLEKGVGQDPAYHTGQLRQALFEPLVVKNDDQALIGHHHATMGILLYPPIEPFRCILNGGVRGRPSV